MGTNISSLNLINTEQLLVQQNEGAEVIKKNTTINITGSNTEKPTSNFKDTTETLSFSTKRSEKELYTSFKSICIANGFNPTDTELNQIITALTKGLKKEVLLNIKNL
jgi:hypothetical protein